MVKTEKKSIEKQYNDLCAQLFPSIETKQQALIKKAFEFAHEMHKGVARLSKDPYITHAINVAHIVAVDMKLDPVCVAVALLHDVLEDTDTTFVDLEKSFGKEIATMVDGLTKINTNLVVHSPGKLKSLQKLLKASIKDPRVIFIKIADRLDNMRSIDFLPRTRQLYISSETKEVYVKIANLLGLEKIKSELENLCLKTTHAQKYYRLDQLIKKHADQKKVEIREFIDSITPVLKSQNIIFSVQVRTKSIASIHDKMVRKQFSFHEICDLIGIRIIISNDDEKLNCWRVYGIISSHYPIDDKRTKDWITKPKDKYGYESLHLTVIGKQGSPVEIQIRTKRMHEIATKGSAAHWKYKEKNLEDIFADSDEWSKNALEMTQHRYDKLKKRLLQ